MKYTAQIVEEIGKTYGPRCCKRDGMIALAAGVRYIREQKGTELETEGAECIYSGRNAQCIEEKCPFFPGKE